MTEKTIIVQNCFGRDKPITSTAFTEKWVGLVDQLVYLVDVPADVVFLKETKRVITAMARRRFAKVLEAQEKE